MAKKNALPLVNMKKSLDASEIAKVIQAWSTLVAKRDEKTAKARQKLIEAQGELSRLEAPLNADIEKLQAVITQSIIERGGTDDIITDVKLGYVRESTRRSVDLDGFWGLAENMPKIWKVVKQFARETTVAARVSIKRE